MSISFITFWEKLQNVLGKPIMLINQPHKARLIDMFLEEGRIWENVIIVAKQVDPIMIADFDGGNCEKS